MLIITLKEDTHNHGPGEDLGIRTKVKAIPYKIVRNAFGVVKNDIVIEEIVLHKGKPVISVTG